MRVSLIKASNDGIVGLQMITFVEPLGLECVAGTLEQEGHTCQIVDFRLETMDEGFAKLRAFGPDIVGLQGGFTTERYRVVYFAQRIKRELPDAKVVVGGHDASRDPNWFMHDGIDVVAVGDGEEVIAGLVEAWEKDQDLRKVPGVVINTSDGPFATGPAPARRPLNDLPLPARHLLKDYTSEYYINFRRPLALVETARGCPFKCNFCSVWKFHEHTFREKSPERVVEELAQVE
ncbi:MAG: hopanoid C-3 methylase HpnR, partial [bacterium]|nr:hopanoid C-3 methylase HpnR [bacterium]